MSRMRLQQCLGDRHGHQHGGGDDPGGESPIAVAVTPDGTKVYVANAGSNNVSVINTATNTVVKTVSVGNAPIGVAITPDGTKVYVANSGSNNVSVIHRPGNTVVATIPVGNCPRGVAITPDGTQAYVANYGDNTVSVIDTATNTVAGLPIPVGTSPDWVASQPRWDTGLRHEWWLQHCFGDQNGQPSGGGDNSGGE